MLTAPLVGCIYGLLQGASFLFCSIFYWRMLTVSNGCMWAAIHTGRAQTVGQSDGSSLSFNTSNKFRPVKVWKVRTLCPLLWSCHGWGRKRGTRWADFAFEERLPFFGSVELIELRFYCRQWICRPSENSCQVWIKSSRRCEHAAWLW